MLFPALGLWIIPPNKIVAVRLIKMLSFQLTTFEHMNNRLRWRIRLFYYF